MQWDSSQLELSPLLSIALDVHPPVVLGQFSSGERRMIAFEGGTFDGADGLRGTVAAGGVDWQTVRSDGVIEIDAHYVLITDQGESVEVRSTGLRAVPPDVVRRLAAGEPVDPTEYYFRTHIRLTTSSARLARLNNLIAVSSGERAAGRVHIHIHEVL